MAFESFEYYLKRKMRTLLLKPFRYWKAYHLGIIDENGEKLREPKDSEEQYYNIFDELIRRIKYYLYKYVPNKGFARYELMKKFVEGGFIEELDEEKILNGIITEDLEVKYIVEKCVIENKEFLRC